MNSLLFQKNQRKYQDLSVVQYFYEPDAGCKRR